MLPKGLQDLSWSPVGRELADCVKLTSCLKGTDRTCEIFGERTKKGKEIGQYTHLESSAPVHCNLFYAFIKFFFCLGVYYVSYLRLEYMPENSQPDKMSPKRRVLFKKLLEWKVDAGGPQLWMKPTRGDQGLGASNWLVHIKLNIGKGPCVHICVYIHIIVCVCVPASVFH